LKNRIKSSHTQAAQTTSRQHKAAKEYYTWRENLRKGKGYSFVADSQWQRKICVLNEIFNQ